jgi:hypothetical protein
MFRNTAPPSSPNTPPDARNRLGAHPDADRLLAIVAAGAVLGDRGRFRKSPAAPLDGLWPASRLSLACTSAPGWRG